MIKKILLTTFITLLVFGAIGTTMVLAQDSNDFKGSVDDQLGALEVIGLPGNETTERPIQIVISIVQAVLGLTSLIFLILILVAGFHWMTAAGNTEQIDKSKKIITSSLIGIVIIFLAYAITAFIFGVVFDSARMW